MLTEQNEKELLERAELAERECDWTKALKFYEQVADLYLSKKRKEEAALIYKKLGYVNMYAGYTVNNIEEFTRYKKTTINFFEKAEILFDQSNNKIGVKECKVGVFQIEMETATSRSELKIAGEKTFELLMQLYAYYNKKGDKENLATILTYCADTISTLLNFSSEFDEFYELSQKGINFANEAWKTSKGIGNVKILVESLILKFSLQPINIMNFRDDAEFRNTFKNLLFESSEALKLIEKKNEHRSLALAHQICGLINYFFAFHYIEDEKKQDEYYEVGLKHLETSLGIASKIQDKLIKFFSVFYLDWWLLWSGDLEYLQKRIVNDISELEEFHGGMARLFKYSIQLTNSLAVYYAQMAHMDFFMPTQRTAYAKIGLKYVEDFLKNFPHSSQVPLSSINIFNVLSNLYSQLALLTGNKDKQDLYLKKMLDYSNRTYELGRKTKGGSFRAYGYLSKFNAYKTLSEIAQNEKDKINFLTTAVD
ncbi:MAG: hypothetical protein ACFFG0_32295, partial [Candidatus Thorarchaeota archaeon]